MITHRPGLLRLGYDPAGGQWRQAVPSVGFYINQGVFGEPMPLFQQSAARFEQSRSKWRIQKHDVVGLRGCPEKAHRVTLLNLGADGPPLDEPGPQFPDGNRILFHELHVRRPPGQSLETQRTASRKQIETARAGQPRAYPIEEGLAHPVGRRTNLFLRWETQTPAAPHPAYDSQHTGARGTIRHGRTL